MRYLLRTALVIGLGSMLPGVVLGQQGHGGHGTPAPVTQAGDAATLDELTGEAFDVAFMSMMIAHHEGAVEMAEWLLERTEDADLRVAAEAVIAAQGPEIERMTEWLAHWYGREVDDMSAQMMRTEMAAMMDAMAAGESADRAFLEMMTEHHLSAIDMAGLALVRTRQSELRALARDIIVAQAQEVFQYQEWLAQGR